MRYCLLSLICAIAFILNGCNLGGQDSSTLNDNQVKLSISNLAPIPYTDNKNNYSLISITNSSNQDLQLDDVNMNKNEQMIYNIQKQMDTSSCAFLAAKSSCTLKVYPNGTSGSYILSAEFSDKKQQKYKISQLISFVDNLSLNAGFIYNQENTTNESSDFSLPVELVNDYDDIKASYNGHDLPVYCSNGYVHSSLCTISVAKEFYNQESSIQIIGSKAGFTNNIANAVLLVNPNLSANLIISAVNPTINPANGQSPITLTLFNNGSATAQQVKINPISPLLIENINCGDSLAAGSSCEFKVNTPTNLISSGQSQVLVNYVNKSGNQILPLNVSYILPNVGASLVTSMTGTFVNSIVNGLDSYIAVVVSNNGNTTLTNLKFSDLYNINQTMHSFVIGSSCSDGQTLVPGGSCIMRLSYAPTSVTALSSLQFVVSANYLGASGNNQTYANSSLSLFYSAINNEQGKFKAVGDFGMLLTSGQGGAGTWTIDVDNPFTTSSINANDILVNNDVYAMTLSNGRVMYSNNNGLFWKQSTFSGAFNGSSCKVVYDGSYYYTCGRTNGTFGACSTNGRGCIIRTTNPSLNDWTALAQANSSVEFNDINYFTYNANKAYVVTVADTAANRGLATSSNGSSWTIPTNSGMSGNNTNFTPVVMNSDSGLLTAWNSRGGFSSSQNIASVSNTWTANSSQRVVNDNNITAKSSLYQDGVYLTAMSNGKIYASINPAQTSSNPYVLEYDGSVNLNKLVYASEIDGGSYLAIGNTGNNIMATDPLSNWTNNTTNNTANGLVRGQNTTNMDLTGASYDNSHNDVWLTGTSSIFKSQNSLTKWITPAITSITRRGSGYLAVDNMGHMYSSIDAVNWSNIDLSHVAGLTVGTVLNNVYCLGDSLCFAVGESGTVLKTTDGSSWNKLVSGTSYSLHSILCQGLSCVIVGGNNTADSGIILYSNDYTTWNVASNSLASTSLNSITSFNNRYFVVGDGGVIFSSVNGINWITNNSGTTNNLNSIACGDSMGCVAVGNGGVIRTSTDGISWSSQSSSTSNDLMSVSYNARRFAIVGKGSILLYNSYALTSWSGATFPHWLTSNANNLYAVIPD